MRAGIYARISEDRDETRAGVGRQTTDCEALAEKRGWTVAERYVDNDISAYKNRRRPEWERMLSDIAAGHVDAVVVYHLDRLIRQPRDLERFFDVCDRAGVRAMATVSGDIDLGTDDGRFHARILGAVARKSSDDQSRRLTRMARDLAQAGKPTGGGDRPFGFEPDRVTVRESEAAIIRELADRLLAGESLRALCADLDRRSIRTPRGLPWKGTPLRRMLASARISGQREHHREIVGAAVWDAIITPEQTAQIRALFADPTRRAVRPARAYPLKGVLRCWRCDSPLVARPRGDGDRRYVCARGPGLAGCGGVYVLAEPVETFVAEAVCVALDTPELRRRLRASTPPADREWQQRADRTQARLDELATAYAAEAISMREWIKARDPLQRQLDDARRQLARSDGVTVLAEFAGRGVELRGRWDALGVERQNAIVRSVLSAVIVKPGRRGFNRFDPARFELVWH